MSKKFKGTIILLLLFESCFANPEKEGRAFAEMLQQKPLTEQQATVDELCRQSGSSTLEAQTSTLESLFGSQFDAGKKGEDPLKSSLATQNLEASKREFANQPSLGDVEHLLKQKHRFKISPEDTLFKKQQEISKASLEDSEGIFQKGQPETPIPVLKDKVVTCRVGVPGQEKQCIKNRVIHLTPPSIRTVSVVLAARAFHQVTFTINFANNTISLVHDYPTDTDYKPNPLTILNKDGIIGWSGISQSLTNSADVAQINFASSDNSTATVLQHPNPNNGYVGVVRFAPSGSYMQVLKAHLSWQVVGYPNLGPDSFEGCEDLERQAIDSGCEMVSSEQQSLNEARIISGYPTPVTREYWSEHKAFVCGAGPDVDECETLVKQHCEQIDSQCAVLKNGVCIEFENTFKCGVPDYLQGDGLSFKTGELSFLKGSDNQSIGYAPQDFGEAVTQFNALTEMGKKLQDELGGILGDPDNPSVFHGKCSQCRVNIGSFFRDCCKLKGILQGLFGQCNEEEKKLAVAAIKNKRCVKIEGRYCHKKKLGVCVEKRDSYCCYGSQLARIIQEIAHQQLGITWGTAEHPDCGSLTAEQLSRLDFDTPYAQSKLSEILAEVQATAQEKFERVQNAVASMGNVQSKIDSLKDKQAEAFYKNPVVSDKLKVRAEEERRKELIEEYEALHGKSFPEHHENWMADISQLERELHGGAAERGRKLKKIKEYQTMESELNRLEDTLAIQNKSYGIPKAGTPDQELLHWFDNIVGEPGVDAHIEGIYKPRLKTYQKLETTTPSEYADLFIQTFGNKFDRSTIEAQYQHANGQRRKLLIESLDLSSPHRSLLNAAAIGDLVAVQHAFGCGAGIDAIQENGYTALQLAIIFNRDLALIDFLINKGSSLTYKENEQNKTALELAETLKRQDIIERIRRAL